MPCEPCSRQSPTVVAAILDAMTSDSLVKGLCAAGGSIITMTHLRYSVPGCPRFSLVHGVGNVRILWKEGMTHHSASSAPARSTGLEGLPVGDPEHATRRRPPSRGRARGQGSGRQQGRRGGRGAPPRRSAIVDRMAALAADAPFDVDDEDSLQCGAAESVGALRLGEEQSEQLVGFILGEGGMAIVGEADAALREAIADDPAPFVEMVLGHFEGDLEDEVSIVGPSGNPSSAEMVAEAVAVDIGIEAANLAGAAFGPSGDGGDVPELASSGLVVPQSAVPTGASSSSPGLSPLAPPAVASSATGAVEQWQTRQPDAEGAETGDDVDPISTVEFEPVAGFVRRNGVTIGKLTPWANGKNLGIKCWMHPSCTLVVSHRVPVMNCVRWIAMGIELPDPCSAAERAALKQAHKAVPRPKP